MFEIFCLSSLLQRSLSTFSSLLVFVVDDCWLRIAWSMAFTAQASHQSPPDTTVEKLHSHTLALNRLGRRRIVSLKCKTLILFASIYIKQFVLLLLRYGRFCSMSRHSAGNEKFSLQNLCVCHGALFIRLCQTTSIHLQSNYIDLFLRATVINDIFGIANCDYNILFFTAAFSFNSFYCTADGEDASSQSLPGSLRER